MKTHHLFRLLAAVLVFHGISALGQDAESEGGDSRSHFPYWLCESPGGKFMVNLHTISFVSTHEYIVDGLALVTELNIATDNPLKVRFYAIDGLEDVSGSATVRTALNSAKSKLEKIQDRVDPSGHSLMVAKTYPSTTHAGTVEYRLRDREQVMKLYENLERAWRKKDTTKVKVER